VQPQVVPDKPLYRVGDTIPFTGAYRVFHAAHRASHDVILFAGQKFPRCNRCGHDVHFELIARTAEADDGFQVFEIPHPEEPAA
jgi:hypothetical protein